jgi:hypothetical protein
MVQARSRFNRFVITSGAIASVVVLLGACGGSGKGTSPTDARPADTGATSTSPAGTSPTGASTLGTGATATTGPTTTSSTPSSPGSGEISPGVVTGSSGSVAATMHAAGHHPRVGKPWPISFAATDAGKPAHAEVSYEYLFAGQVVAHRSHYKFTDSFHDTFKWPSSAVGFPLTFRAVITSGGVTLNLDYAVQVVG